MLAGLAWVAVKGERLRPTFRSLARASLAVLAFNFMGDGLRDALDPQLRNR